MSRGFVIAVIAAIAMGIAAVASEGDPGTLAVSAVTIICAIGVGYTLFLPVVGVGVFLKIRLWMFPSERERLVELYHYLARWLRLGHDLPEALNQRLQDNEPAWLRNAMRRIQKRLLNGEPLSLVAAAHRNIFSSADCGVIEAGEKSGRLPEAFEYLAATTRSRELHNFPVALVLAEFLMPVFIIGFVLIVIVPKFKDIFDQLGAELPWLTTLIVYVSYIVSNQFLVIVLGLVLLVILLKWIFRTPTLVQLLFALCPPLRRWYWPLPLSRFSFALGSLLGSGFAATEAIAMAVKAASNPLIRQKQSKMIANIENGQPLDQCLSAVALFPPRFLYSVGRGVRREKPDEALLAMADSYQREFERNRLIWSGTLFPILIIILGFTIAVFAVAMYLPLFSIPKVVGSR